MKSILKVNRAVWAALLLMLSALCVCAPRAYADTVLLSSTTMVAGSGSAVFSFDAPTSGTVTAQLTNLPWPERLSSLSFTATSASDVISSWTAPTAQVETFQVTSGTYFAHIMATASGALNLGLYSLTLSFSPTSAVPLPASDWMLLTGVLALFGLIRLFAAIRPFDMLPTARAAEG